MAKPPPTPQGGNHWPVLLSDNPAHRLAPGRGKAVGATMIPGDTVLQLPVSLLILRIRVPAQRGELWWNWQFVLVTMIASVHHSFTAFLTEKAPHFFIIQGATVLTDWLELADLFFSPFRLVDCRCRSVSMQGFCLRQRFCKPPSHTQATGGGSRLSSKDSARSVSMPDPKPALEWEGFSMS